MPMNPDDPRVKKTRRALREAFIRLILKQGYDSISIQDIVDEAEAARVTFYRHYKDKEELLTDCLNTLYTELAARTEPITRDSVLSGYTALNVFYEHLIEQEQLYRILFSSRGTQTVVERLRHHLAMRALESLELYRQDGGADIPLEIAAYHAASAQIGLGVWWLDHGKPYSAAYMARVALWLSMAGIARVLGIDSFNVPPPTFDER